MTRPEQWLLQSGMELIRKEDYDFCAAAFHCCLKGALNAMFAVRLPE
jgi:hypothetical protein